MNQIGRFIIFAGIFLIVFGLLLKFLPQIKFIGKLPGDIHIRKENFEFYFPLTTSILLSIILSLIIRFFVSK